ncbi:MAG: OsmC family protein [Vulcanimicrobiaceae bacterium]
MSAVREHVYRTTVTWSGAAAGPTRSYAAYSREHSLAFEGKPALRGSADPAFRGDAALLNPEELLLASLSACHLLTYLALCAREGIAVVSYVDEAHGSMVEKAGAGRFERAVLRPRVTIEGDRVERALALHDRAKTECFIANSVNFPVEHEPVVTTAPTAAGMERGH